MERLHQNLSKPVTQRQCYPFKPAASIVNYAKNPLQPHIYIALYIYLAPWSPKIQRHSQFHYNILNNHSSSWINDFFTLHIPAVSPLRLSAAKHLLSHRSAIDLLAPGTDYWTILNVPRPVGLI